MTIKPGFMSRISIPTMLSLLSGVALAAAATNELDLQGEWRFALDREDQGISEQWFNRELEGRLQLPGSLTAQGFGDAVTINTRWMGDIVDRSYFTAPEYEPYRQPGNIKVPFWLQPEKYYAGAAWYQRAVEIPASWAGKRLVLRLERPHWGATVWVDDKLLGTNVSLATPHEFDATSALLPGKRRVTIRVDNRYIIAIGPNSHSVSDHTQGNWNGIIGALKVIATDRVWLDDLQVYPAIAQRKVKIAVGIGNLTKGAGSGTLSVSAASYNQAATQSSPAKNYAVKWGPENARVEIEYELDPRSPWWSEFSPVLYRLKVVLNGRDRENRYRDENEVSFGLREVKRDGTQIAINGRKIFLRGTLECCIFPLTGHPPMDVDSWKRIIRVCQAHGLNHIRFHSWCPPEAAFQAADEMGFYFYVECPTWANQGTSVGDGRPVDQWIYAEGDRILRAYGNHPSFIMMSYGNEPAGKNQNRWLGDLIKHWKSQDPRRLYTSGAGWPMIPENDFHVTPAPRIQAWGGGLKSRINANPPETMTDYRDFIAKAGAPVVSHEIGQWCVYPNFDEIPKYKGLLKPRNFEIFRDSLKARGLADQARAFLLASGKLQTLCYKEDIESALRTPGMAGFELLDLHDFPGQGTALVGVLDPFWDSKGYVMPEEFHRFACQTVPLARLKKRLWQNHETFAAQIEIAHFGPKNLTGVKPVWRIRDAAGKAVANGALKTGPIPTGTQTAVGEISLPLQQFAAATKLNLEVALEGATFANDWDFWVYPAKVDTAAPPDILVKAMLDEPALAALKAGGKVLLAPPPARIKGDQLGRVQIGFSSIFWNTAWTHRQPPHTLGILCDPKHPALKDFPTEYHSNWQWWELVSRAHPYIMNDTPPAFRPLVQAIDDWVTNRKLALVWEAQVAGGQLLACGMDISSDLDNRPVARQLRRSLLDYMAGNQFKPATQLPLEYLQSLLAEPSLMQKLGAKIIKTDSAQENFPADNLLDGDQNTIWHTAWGEGAPNWPHHVVIGFDQAAELKGATLLPRQDNNRNGWIKEYALYISADGQSWGEPVAKGTFEANAQPKEIKFPNPVQGRFLKLEALAGFNPQPFASLAELTVW
jgi:hypothetical protein